MVNSQNSGTHFILAGKFAIVLLCECVCFFFYCYIGCIALKAIQLFFIKQFVPSLQNGAEAHFRSFMEMWIILALLTLSTWKTTAKGPNRSNPPCIYVSFQVWIYILRTFILVFKYCALYVYQLLHLFTPKNWNWTSELNTNFCMGCVTVPVILHKNIYVVVLLFHALTLYPYFKGLETVFSLIYYSWICVTEPRVYAGKYTQNLWHSILIQFWTPSSECYCSPPCTCIESTQEIIK